MFNKKIKKEKSESIHTKLEMLLSYEKIITSHNLIFKWTLVIYHEIAYIIKVKYTE